jgi:hypothetical protein
VHQKQKRKPKRVSCFSCPPPTPPRQNISPWQNVETGERASQPSLAGRSPFYGWRIDPVARVGVFASPGFQTLVIQFELVLGLWLLSGKWLAGAWLTSVATFSVFASFSCYSGLIGQATCGCFGTIHASPWWAFGIDVGILISLAFVRPDPRGWLEMTAEERSMRLRTVVCFLASVAATLCLLWGGASLIFGSVPAVLAHFRGETITVIPSLLDVGRGLVGELRSAQIEIKNWSDKPVRVVGGTSDCSCGTTSGLPIEIAPGQTRPLSVSVRFPPSEGIFTRTAMLLGSRRRRSR